MRLRDSRGRCVEFLLLAMLSFSDGSKINNRVCRGRRKSWLNTVYVYPFTVSPRFSLPLYNQCLSDYRIVTHLTRDTS